MSEDEARRAQQDEAGDEVEAHRRRIAETDEPAEESDKDDDVEAHRRVV